jgi:fumarate hydratase subunit beta
VYFGATGGAGALLSKCITAAKVIAFDELGPEAIRELTVVDFPLLVINDSHGGELYVQPDRKAAGLE